MRFTYPHRVNKHSQQETKQCKFSTTTTTTNTNPKRYYMDDSSTRSTSSTVTTSNISSGSRSIGSKTKKVRFRVTQFTYIDPPPESFPPVHASELFYTKEDMAEIFSDNRAILRCIQRDAYCCFCDDVDSPARGLEDRTMEGARRRFCNQRNACQAVLHEQERQRKEGIFEPEALAEIYAFLSKGCKNEAESVGMRDAAVAKEVMHYFETSTTIKETRDEETARLLLQYFRSSEDDDEGGIIKLPPSPTEMFLGGCVRHILGLQRGHRKNKSLPIQFVSL